MNAGLIIALALVVFCAGAAVALAVHWDDIVKFWRRR